MHQNRRKFLKLLFGSAVLSISTTSTFAKTSSKGKIKAIAFDAFPIFDPRPIFALVNSLYPEKGNELSQLWRTRQFEYQWLRALSGKYTDFWQSTEDGLVFAAKQLKVSLSEENKDLLMGAYLNLKPWPDVVPALQTLIDSNIRLVFLSNMTHKMLNTNMRNNRIEKYFEHTISTDKVKTFKPDPKAYQLGVDILKLKRHEIVFAAFAGWDVAGAKWFGYPTFWVNRAGFLGEELGVQADAVGNNLNDLIGFVNTKNKIIA